MFQCHFIGLSVFWTQYLFSFPKTGRRSFFFLRGALIFKMKNISILLKKVLEIFEAQKKLRTLFFQGSSHFKVKNSKSLNILQMSTSSFFFRGGGRFSPPAGVTFFFETHTPWHHRVWRGTYIFFVAYFVVVKGLIL